MNAMMMMVDFPARPPFSEQSSTPRHSLLLFDYPLCRFQNMQMDFLQLVSVNGCASSAAAVMAFF
jgi:hypothetical protein